MQLRVQALCGARQRRAWSLSIGRRGVITLLGVTAGNVCHNASNARGVTAGKMGRNSSIYIIIRDCTRVGAFPRAFCVPNSVALASLTLQVVYIH